MRPDTASNLTMESPSRVALAASITNLTGREGMLLRPMIPLGILVLIITTMCGAIYLRFFRMGAW
ncbi:hypothetical protein CVV65_12305 [Kyrpidia spormannii]|uniref:Uncharacterized protein n=1 Tax=Kyrpidia spormannii TaxID=2055160 RepID=A0A2K8NAZ5_9BACL|nr:hypothetical protein CVV65_12305 [Kyrpidia spormannii]